MDFYAVNRGHLNRRRISRIDNKIIVIVVPSIIQLGVVGTEIRFPLQGTITDVYATCGTPGDRLTKVTIEKCSDENYQGTVKWEDILINPLQIDSNGKSSSTSSRPYSINPRHLNIQENDHFRLNVLEVGQGVRNITVEIVVQVKIEEEFYDN